MVEIDIISFATNYKFFVYERFIVSLYNTGFNGKLYILISRNDKKNLDKLKIKYNNIYYFLIEDIKININFNTHINNKRFFYLNYVLNNFINKSNKYLLLTDFRDVLFQKNIEKYNFDKEVDLYGFLEDIKFNQNLQCNGRWIKQLDKILNKSIYEMINNNKVICCGTTIAKNNTMKKYIEIMCDYIKKYKISENLDQGLHNYFLYFNILKDTNIKLLSNIDNLVNTVGCSNKIINNDYIVNKNNEISYIVHQYDRFSKELKEIISKKNNLNFIDKR